MTYHILQSRIAEEPASTERLHLILRGADRRGTAHLPEPEALVAAIALNNTGFFQSRYQSPAQAGSRAAAVVPDDWRALAFQYQISTPRVPVGRLPRLTNPTPPRFGEPAITLHRGGQTLKVRFSEHLDPIALPGTHQTRDEAPPGWLAIGALAGLLDLDFTGRRLFEMKHRALSEVFPEQIIPFLEVGKWLGFTPVARASLEGPIFDNEQPASIGRHKEDDR